MEIFWKSILACTFLWNSVISQPHQTWEKGFSDQYKSENTLGQYAFGYNEDHTSGGSFRRETGDQYGNKIGSYGLRISDGRIRIVNYVADHNGYRADVVSNEPGIASQGSNGLYGISKNSIYGVTIPGLRFSAEVPYLTFSNGHQQIPEEAEQKEMATAWEDQMQDHGLSSEEEQLYAQANAITDAAVVKSNLSEDTTNFEASSPESKFDAATENNFAGSEPQHAHESRTVEIAVETTLSSSRNSTDHAVEDPSEKDSA